MTEETNTDTGEQVIESVQEAVRVHVEPMSMDDIMKAAADFSNGGQDAEPAPAEEAGGDGDDTLPAEEEEAPEPVAAKGKNDRIRVPKARLDEEAAKVKEWKARTEATEARLAEEERKNKSLSDFIKKGIPGVTEPESDKPAKKEAFKSEDIIDETLAEETRNEFQKRDAEAALNSFFDAAEKADQLGNASNPKYSEAVSIVLASDAYKIIVSNAAMGIEVSDEEAMNQAKHDNAIELMRVHAANKRNPAKMAEYMIHRASALGYQAAEKAAPAKQKSTVDMQAVDRLRKEAGAPVMKRESAATLSAADWGSDVAKKYESKYGNIDHEYLKKWGIG